MEEKNEKKEKQSFIKRLFSGGLSKLNQRKKAKKPKENTYNNSPVNIMLTVQDDDDNDDKLASLNKETPAGIEFKFEKQARSAEDDVFEELNGSAHKEAFRFKPNSTYTTVLLYAIFFIVIAALIVIGIAKGSFTGALKYFLSAVSPFIVAIFVALVLERPICWLEEHLWSKLFKKKPRLALQRILSILITYVIFFGLIFILFRFVIPQLIQSIQDLTSKSEDMVDRLLIFVSEVEEKIPGVETGAIQKYITDSSTQIQNFFVQQLLPKLLQTGIATAKTIFNIIISIIVSIYMLYDKRNLKISALRIVYSILPVAKANRVSSTVSECTDIFTNFIFGKTLDSLIIGILSFIVLSIMGFPYSVLVSVIIGVTNMIPYFGPFIGAVPGAIIYLCYDPKQCLIFLIVVLIIQQLDGLVIGPKILGDSTGLSPLWVIIGTTLGGAYGNVLGMFLGVPVIAVISYLLGQLFDAVLEKKNIDIG
jgi:predicted PurR-regulated permease PerM